MDNEMESMQATILQLTKERELLVTKTRQQQEEPNVADEKKAEEELMEWLGKLMNLWFL